MVAPETAFHWKVTNVEETNALLAGEVKAGDGSEGNS